MTLRGHVEQPSVPCGQQPDAGVAHGHEPDQQPTECLTCTTLDTRNEPTSRHARRDPASHSPQSFRKRTAIGHGTPFDRCFARLWHQKFLSAAGRQWSSTPRNASTSPFPGVTKTSLPIAEGQKFKYRYSGLHLPTETGGRLSLISAADKGRTGTILVPYNDSVRIQSTQIR